MALRATPHVTMDFCMSDLRTWSRRSRGGDVNWPPRSCDLTPLDFFLWAYLKSQVYTNKPQTIDALKANIINAIQQIQPDLCDKSSKIGPPEYVSPSEAAADI